MLRRFKPQYTASSNQKHLAGKECLGLAEGQRRTEVLVSLFASHCVAKLK